MMKDKKEKKKSKSKSKNGSTSRTSAAAPLSVFNAVERLQNQDDSVARRKRSASSVKQERANSLAALSQQSVYTKLLETRILLQRSLQQQQQANDKNDDNNNHAALNQCNELLINLLTARRQLLKRSPVRNEREDDDDDDNIVDYESLVLNDRPSKKAKTATTTATTATATKEEPQVVTSSLLENQLQGEFETCQAEWQSVLNRRNHDVRLHTGAITAAQSQFRVINSNFWQQVESTVLHQKQQQQQQYRQQQQQQTQDHESESDDDSANAQSTAKQEEEEEEKEKDKSSISLYPAFDDAKIYQQLLKDFVAVSSADHASQAGAASLAAQARLDKALRKKNKASASSLSSSSAAASSSKLVDRRASKGRKLRYTTMPKLVNFTFPLSRGGRSSSTGGGTEQQPSLDEDAWFKSLFGGTAAKRRTEN